MIATELTFAGKTNTGAFKYIATIYSSTTPSDLNISGADVENMTDTDICATGSVLITPSENFIAFEDGVFTQKG